MKRTLLAAATAVLLGGSLVGCSDTASDPVAPIAPSAKPSNSLLGLNLGGSTANQTVYGAFWKSPLTSDLHTTASIGPLGGVLTLPATGLTVIVPPGAVLKQTQFGVTALAGRVVAYDFQPAGTRFLLPLVVTQSANRVEMNAPLVGLSVMRPGYFRSATDIDQTSGQATVAEVLPQITIDLLGNMVFTVPHFSGYIVSWGAR
jgi:hypothetical protein